MDRRIELLAKEFNKDESRFKISDEAEDVIIEDDDAEYLVVDEDTADELCRADIESFIDESGITGFTKDFQYWIIENAVDPEFLFEAAREEIDVLSDEDEWDTVSDLEDAIDEKNADYILSYFVNLWGEEETYDWLKDAVDTDKVTEGVIDWDGRGHLLATYDSEEIELADNGNIEYYAYRIN